MTAAASTHRTGRRPAALAAVSVGGEVIGRALLGMVSALLFWSIVPNATGWSSEVVVSGSMMPRIAPGDVVVTQPVAAETLIPGQVVLVSNPARPGTLLMHRLVARNPDGTLKTRGDANTADDSTPVPAAMVRGLPRLRIPYVGLPMVWLRNGEYGTLVLVALVLLGALVISAGPGGAGPADREPAGGDPAGSDPIAPAGLGLPAGLAAPPAFAPAGLR